MTSMNREEFLFWRHIDALVASSDTAEVSGLGYQCNENKTITGVGYTDLNDDFYFAPLLRLSYCITSKGFQVQIFTSYDGISEKVAKEWDAKIIEGLILCTKTFDWDDFVFDKLIAWIKENSDWDRWLAKYAKQSNG